MSEKKADVPQLSTRNWVRVTLTAASVKPLEKVTDGLIKKAKDQNLRVKGPVRMPTKVLRITTRKTPCGEGSKTWDRFQFRIHKRVIDLLSTDEATQQLKHIYLEPGVNCDVKVAGDFFSGL
ncbi:unnamed protein product [Schistosoma intercalatum]|nr:unnamed protein product [Schistosoma intercalatum]CAH8559432.1 unnamed protein product [Schistosoma intercalatum]